MENNILKQVMQVIYRYIAPLLAFIIVFSGFYVVSVDEFAVILRLGKVVRSISEPGLYFKYPFFDSSVKFTKRLMEYDAAPVAVVTSDKKNLVFDTVAVYRINDPETFYRRVRTVAGVLQRLDDSVYSAVRVIAGRMTFDDLIKNKRQEALLNALAMSNTQSKEYGIEILTVVYKRVFLPKDNEQAVYRSMQAERNRVAGQLRAEGQAEAISRKSSADKKEVEIISSARKRAEEIKGEGDRVAQETIANAVSESKELYLFLKTLDFYKDTFNGTPIIIDPRRGIMQYLVGPGKEKKETLFAEENNSQKEEEETVFSTETRIDATRKNAIGGEN